MCINLLGRRSYPRETLVLLDFSTCPTPTAMATMIQSAASIAQQSSTSACLLKYPVRVASQSESVWLNTCRKIEDRLLACGLCLGSTINAIINTREAHGNDRRDGVLQFRLCIPDSFKDESPWLQSQAMSQHKMITDVHLLPVKDLRFVPQADPLKKKEHLSQPERNGQMGPRACQQILTALMVGRANGGARERKVLVFDAFPMFGDWLDACWHLHHAFHQGRDVPMVVYSTRYIDTEVSEYNGMRSRVQQMLMEEWWPSQPAAGSEEPLCTAEDAVEKPDLRLLAWARDGSKATFPQILLSKFEADSEFHGQWKAVCADAQMVIDQLADANTHCSGTSLVGTTPSGGVALTGPDLDGQEPFQFGQHVELETVAASDFDFDKV